MIPSPRLIAYGVAIAAVLGVLWHVSSQGRTIYAYPAGTASMPTTGNTAAQKTGAIVRRPTPK